MSMDAPTTLDMTKGLYRRVYAGFINGKRINAVSLESEAFFWRLHAVVDDFGNYHGDHALLRSGTQGRREFSIQQIGRWVKELESTKLVVMYESGGETYLNIADFVTRQPGLRNGRRIKKFPQLGNPGESGGIPVDVGECGNGSGGGSGSGKGVQGEDDYPPGMVRVWDAAPQVARDRSGRAETHDIWRKLKLESGVDEILAGLERWKCSREWTKDNGEYIKGLHRWLKLKKWKEHPAPSKAAAAKPKPESDEQTRERVAKLSERQRADADRQCRVKAVAEANESLRAEVREKVIAAAPAEKRKMLERADFRINDEPGRMLLSLMYAEIALQKVAFG